MGSKRMRRWVVDNLDVFAMSIAGMGMGLHWWQLVLLAAAVGVGAGLTTVIKEQRDLTTDPPKT